MSSKQIDVTCPCCSARLSIDVLTGRVMRTEAGEASSSGDKWDTAHRKVLGRTQSGAEKLEKGLDEERGKKARLDDLFDAARKKLKPGDAD